jgi:Type VI secretion system effector, Hcp
VTGPQGPPGTNGTPGTNGAPGKSATLIAGNTLTLSGGQVVTIGNSPVVTFASPPIGTRSVATLSFTGGITTDILSYGFAAKTSGSGGASGKVAVHDIQITKLTDKSSPKLFLACVNGQHFKKATLIVRKAGGKQVVYTLTDVLIAAAQSTGHGQKLADLLTLNYANLTVQIGKPHA